MQNSKQNVTIILLVLSLIVVSGNFFSYYQQSQQSTRAIIHNFATELGLALNYIDDLKVGEDVTKVSQLHSMFITFDVMLKYGEGLYHNDYFGMYSQMLKKIEEHGEVTVKAKQHLNVLHADLTELFERLYSIEKREVTVTQARHFNAAIGETILPGLSKLFVERDIFNF